MLRMIKNPGRPLSLKDAFKIMTETREVEKDLNLN